MRMSIQKRLEKELTRLSQQNAYRKLPRPTEGLDFCSNDYLGLAKNKSLQTIIQKEFSSQNLSHNGATGSRLLSGNNEYYEATECCMANYFEDESALLLNSGYMANIALLSSVPNRRDTIIYDQACHASIKDGIRLSQARHTPFKHNDLNDLHRKLKQASGNIFIMVESIYSMLGDCCPLAEIVSLAQQFDAEIILDEAHSTGIYGQHGQGLAHSMELHDHIFARIFTFGKAIGSHGAAILGSNQLIKYLINKARPFIYTTALPLHSVVSIRCGLNFISEHPSLLNQLWKNMEIFNKNKPNTLNIGNSARSPIQSITIPTNESVQMASQEINNLGYQVLPIRSPTVPKGQECIRICLHADHTKQQLIGLLEALQKVTASI